MTTSTKSSTSHRDVDAAPVATYVREQTSAIREGDAALRRGEDPIHATRVAIRRLRSTLRVFTDAFDPSVATHLDQELSWYASILGHVRDHEVQRDRFAHAVADLPDEWVLGPVAADIETTLAAEQRTYRADVDTVLTGDRYAALISALDTLDSTVPALSHRKVTSLANKAGKKARTRLKSAIVSEIGDDEVFHRARKAFKRARYASELATPLTGKKRSKTTIRQYKHVQEVLGEHQDSLVAAQFLRRLGASAGTRPAENGFTYGLLFAYEQQAAAAALRRARALKL
ncbi:CHAD domain-containing protein [Rhodococcoides yunnanense]|uniref:CHAD domain-containing protein n=1 Tax=Rhodococcoides yunnanense TaxID=278209 RepID=A0ABU4B7B4_9NOCA|nr:CHAD domain-containing protein [Rhodococcus yunnanensis]MDV6260077.1 CHAD domain-containing protein [Rhodococcus yunnanensis]